MLALLPYLIIATVFEAPLAEPSCPTTIDVEAELARLGAASAWSDQRSIEISVWNGRMHVVLRNLATGGSAAREVAAPADCHERALVVAVLITAWSGLWEEQEDFPIQQRTLPATKTPPEKPIPSRQAIGELAAFGFGTGDGNAVASGFGVEGGVRFENAVVAGVAQMTFSRDRMLGSARVTYGSIVTGIRVGWHHPWGNWWVRPELAMLAVRWSLQGKDLGLSRSATDWGFGLDGRLRFGVALGNWAPFAFVTLQRTITQERLILDDRPDTTDLPAWNLGVGLGLAFTFRRG